MRGNVFKDLVRFADIPENRWAALVTMVRPGIPRANHWPFILLDLANKSSIP
jgi:hypothetical protein